MTDRLDSRMYFFVPYNLSDIQKGIQAGHASLEYAHQFGDTKLFQDFVRYNKTWIILNGGTTRDKNVALRYRIDMGTLNELVMSLQDNSIPCAIFREPDLNMAVTAVCFIAEEPVYDYEKYPEYYMWTQSEFYPITLAGSITVGQTEYVDPRLYLDYQQWVDTVMQGEKNVFLRELIKGKSLA